MAKKEKKKPENDDPGVPEWVVTFGDMMSLLLCFFILLQMFSELKQDHEYQRVITAVKEAFGYSGGIGVLPIDDPPLKSMIEVLESMAQKSDRDKTKISHNDDPGIHGPDIRVKKLQDGIVFTIGGPSTFDPESAVIKAAVQSQIERLATMLAGRKNLINIVGHASPKRLSAGSPWADLDDLSYARAKAVKKLLLKLGLEESVLRLKAAGINEPVHPRAMGEIDAADNRRVEIILTEKLVEDVNPDAHSTDPRFAQGG